MKLTARFTTFSSPALAVVFAAVVWAQAPSSKPVPARKSDKPKPKATEAAPPAPPPATVGSAPNESTVWCLAYRGSPSGRSVGVCKPVRIQVGGREHDKIRIGFFESEVLGSGDEWRSAGWSAAVTAAQLTDFDPRAMQVSYECEGVTDGPSAGALMTIGVLAAVRGDQLREDAAMTGTINPDGTIGPVGGIPYKIEGAASLGKKLVLIPAGIRLEDDDEGNEIDLIRHGRSLGIEVKPVVDIYAAYKLMTGVDLPRHPEADEPYTTDAVDDLAGRKTAHWLDTFQSVVSDHKKRPATAHNDRSNNLLQEGLTLLGNGLKFRDEGQFAVSYWDAVQGTAYAYLGAEIAKNIHSYQHGGRRGMARRVRDNQWLKDDILDVSRRMQRETPKSLDQLSMYLIACGVFFESLALQTTADVELEDVPADPGEEYDELIFSASAHQIVAYLDLRITEDLLDFMAVCEGDPIPDDAPIGEVADFYWRAGDANMAVFDSIVTEEISEVAGVSMDKARFALMASDPEYAVLFGMQKAVLTNIEGFFGDGEAYQFANLAAGLTTYPRSAGLIAKYYSLNADVDEDAQVVSVPREATLNDWLDSLQGRTRRSIGFLQSRGLDMSLCAQKYQISRVRRQRSLNDKFHALSDLLTTYVQAECMRRLAGYKLTDPIPGGQ